MASSATARSGRVSDYRIAALGSTAVDAVALAGVIVAGWGPHRPASTPSTTRVSIESGALQRIQITGEDTAGLLIARLAVTVLDLNAQLADLDTRIAERFRSALRRRRS